MSECKSTKKSNQEITPDPQFHLEDANIALITSDGWAFCVHKSVLRRLSVVFRNMFSDGSPLKSPKQPTKFNDLDAINISEAHDVVRSFLIVAYDSKSVASFESYATLRALMVFCNKYLIHSILEQIIAYLRPRFPNSLAAYQKRMQIRTQDNPLPIADVIDIAEAALEANLKSFLVVGLYFLIANREKTTEYLTQLSRGLLVRYGHAVSKISGPAHKARYSARLDRILVAASENCHVSYRDRRSNCPFLWKGYKDSILATEYLEADPVDILRRYSTGFSSLGICSFCYKTIEVQVSGIFEDLWISLPKLFGIGDSWEALEKEERESLEAAED